MKSVEGEFRKSGLRLTEVRKTTNKSLSLSIPLVMCIRIESSWSDLDFEVGLIELKGTVRGPLFIMDSLINYMDFMMMHFMCTCFPILHGWP